MGGLRTMEKQGWKTLAIIFICLLVAETLLFGYIIKLGLDEMENKNLCYYEVCSGYDNAYYTGGVCGCYNYDLLGELQLEISKVMT